MKDPRDHASVQRLIIVAHLMLLILGAFAAAPSSAEPVQQRVYTTARAQSPPRIDGVIEEPVWDAVPWAGEFVQHDPAQGDPPTHPTQFKILYDDHNLYVAYLAFDPEPDKIASILARRDWFPGDWVEINIDSLHDHRTGFSFTASVSGTQGDEFISEDGNNWDPSWDPVWEHKARIGPDGWSAEVRIPLSQLRFAERQEHTWGIQVQRRLYRKEERSTWQPIRRDENGWVSRFGELRGITGIKAQRRIEILPYALVQEERFESEPGNPFADGSRSEASAGLDAKIGVTSDLTMDLTVNPDFGQVEADPSVVNLTAFESFFQEKRPFFIEGSNILNFRVAPSIAYGTHTSDRLFYSRRIGRSPHYDAGALGAGFTDQPENSSIIGAAKLTGKSARGYSVGLLDAVTARETAEVQYPDGSRHRVDVEPLTNYFVGRLQKDWDRGRTRLGGMLTAVNRSIDGKELRFLHEGATTGGLDFFRYLRGRDTYVAVNVLGSRVQGDEEAILATQTAPARYYQRPDNDGQSVDSTRTSLSGHAGSLRIGRSEGRINFETGAAWRSPGFELNDIGFLRTADEINQFTWIGYNARRPFSVFREMEVNVNQWLDFEYGGENLYQAFNVNTHARFTGNWGYEVSLSRENERISNYELRGGPSMRLPGGVNMEASLGTDENKKLSFEGGVGVSRFDDGAGNSFAIEGGLTWRPTNAVRLQVAPSFERREPELQYVTTASSAEGARYVFGRLDQKTFTLSFRTDLTLTPRLTVQYYGAPFVSAGNYRDFRRVIAPRAADYADRTILLGDAARFEDGGDWYTVDEGGDGSIDYAFGDPDFNVQELQSNLVVRWEYRPGSSLYLVWTHAREGLVPDGTFDLNDDLDRLFGIHPENVFLIKVSRWFSL